MDKYAIQGFQIGAAGGYLPEFFGTLEEAEERWAQVCVHGLGACGDTYAELIEVSRVDANCAFGRVIDSVRVYDESED